MNQFSGYIALTSAIITSAIVMIIVFALGGAAMLNRFDILDATHKERSLATAEACAELALLKLAENPDYTGNETLAVGADQCLILPLETQGGETLVKTEAEIGGAVSRIQAAVDDQSLEVNSWEEVAGF